MSMQNIRFYDFDKYRIDVVNRSLSYEQRAIQIAPKTFDLLLLLIEKRDQWVSKDYLMEQLWPGFATDSNNVDQHLSRLRKILASDEHLETEAGRQRFIKTERGLGVRFQLSVTTIYNEAQESKPEHLQPAIQSEERIEVRSAAPIKKDRRTHLIVISASSFLLLVVALTWIWQSSAREHGQVIADTRPHSTRQEIYSPADEEAVKQVAKETQFIETLTFYTQPKKFDKQQLKQYWLPAEQGGKAAADVEKSINKLLTRKQYYGSESRNEKFEFRYVRIFSPRDYAEVGTTEIWFVPLYNEDGSRVLNRNVRLGPYPVDLTLKKVDGVWLLEGNSTPRSSPSATPSPSPSGQ